jgi:ABC-type uncharacterized transport system permease subunit
LYVFSIIYLTFILGNKEILKEIFFNNLFSSFLIFEFSHQLNSSIFTGSFSSNLILPSNFKLALFIRTLGVTIRGIIFNLLIFVGIIYFFKFRLNLFQLIISLPMVLICGVWIKFFSDFIVGCLSFWLKDGYGVITFIILYSLY